MLRASILGPLSQTAGYMSATVAWKVPLSFFRGARLGTASVFCQCTVQFLRNGFWCGDILAGNPTCFGVTKPQVELLRTDVLTNSVDIASVS